MAVIYEAEITSNCFGGLEYYSMENGGEGSSVVK